MQCNASHHDRLTSPYAVPRTLLPDYLTLSYSSLIDCRFKPLPQVAGALARWRLTGEFAGDPVMLHRAATLRPPGGVFVLGGCPLIPPGEPDKPKLSR